VAIEFFYTEWYKCHEFDHLIDRAQYSETLTELTILNSIKIRKLKKWREIHSLRKVFFTI
jgi:hypothetical protein